MWKLSIDCIQCNTYIQQTLKGVNAIQILQLLPTRGVQVLLLVLLCLQLSMDISKWIFPKKMLSMELSLPKVCVRICLLRVFLYSMFSLRRSIYTFLT